MRNFVANITSLSNDANGAFEDQTLGAAGTLTLNGALASGGVVTFAQAQKISIEGTGNNSGVTATITGTDVDGTVVSEALVLANNGTVTSVLYYKTITSITTSAALTGNIEGGPLSTNGCVSKSLRVNSNQMDFKLGLFADMSGTLTYTIQYAYEQPEGEYSVSYSASADWRAVDAMSAVTADTTGNLFYPVQAVRALISSYTSGTLKLTATQSM